MLTFRAAQGNSSNGFLLFIQLCDCLTGFFSCSAVFKFCHFVVQICQNDMWSEHSVSEYCTNNVLNSCEFARCECTRQHNSAMELNEIEWKQWRRGGEPNRQINEKDWKTENFRINSGKGKRTGKNWISERWKNGRWDIEKVARSLKLLPKVGRQRILIFSFIGKKCLRYRSNF